MKKREIQKRKFTETMKIKLAGLFGVILLALIGLIMGITYINAKSGDKYTKQVLTQSQQQYESDTILFRRGDILDRNGNVLATSVRVYNVILDCQVINTDEDYIEPTIEAVSQAFDLDAGYLEGLLTGEDTKDRSYVIIKRDISMDEKEVFENMKDTKKEGLSDEEISRRSKIKGVWFEEGYKRMYPLNSLACDVIGFSNRNNEATLGLEGYYNSTLNGTNGRKYGYFNQDSTLEQTIIEPVNGNTLVSTIDVNIQKIVEKYIEVFMEELSDGPNGTGRGAQNIGVIVENPQNGEILAMASTDPYDLNNPGDLSGIYSEEAIESMSEKEREKAFNSVWSNYCVNSAYEPGSVVKPIVVASALESGAVTESDKFLCDSGEQVATEYIRCAVYPDAHGTETLGEIIQNSCNDGMMAIGRKMGAALMVEYQEKFNFGMRTGIDLPGESSGMVFTQEQMNETELATTSFGQGFTCTMVQEVAAMASVINGGTYYQPHLVKEVRDDNGTVLKQNKGNILKEVISEEVSADIREYMSMSVKYGTSGKSKVQGYSMGGKTGTAEKIPRGEGNYLVSYIGFAPLDDPQVLIYVVVDEPNVESQADSSYAQYIAQAVLDEILPYMNIYPDEETEEETQLWAGFKGVPRLDQTEAEIREEEEAGGSEIGAENPDMPEPAEDENQEDTEYTNEESDGITNEEAGYEEGEESGEEETQEE
ncbi:MAG: peptidoglycan D,D-transpeptidase FtsI family protein [Blautia sp.]